MVDANKIREALRTAETLTGWTFSADEAYRILKHTERKAMLCGKGESYIPLLYQNELVDFVMREKVNRAGEANRYKKLIAETDAVNKIKRKEMDEYGTAVNGCQAATCH